MRWRHALMAGLNILLWSWAIVATTWSLQVFIGEPWARDFGAFYKSAEGWYGTGDLYDPVAVANVNLNPPHVTLLLFSPALLLRLEDAALVWQLLQVGAGVLAMSLIRRELQIPTARMFWILPLFLASSASQHHWREGQVGGVLLLLSTLAWRAARRDTGTQASWVAAAASIKPWIVCWLPLLTKQRLVTCISLGIAGLAAGVALTGPGAWFDWIATIQDRPVRPNPVNVSLIAAFARASGEALTNGHGGWPYGQPAWPFLCAGLAILTWRARTGSVDRAWVLFGIAAVLISPIGWVYYLLIVTGPLIAWGEQEQWPWPSRVAIALMLATRELMEWAYVGPTGWIGSSFAFLGVLLLWGTVWSWPAGSPALSFSRLFPRAQRGGRERDVPVATRA